MTSTPEQVIAKIRDRVGTEFDDEATFTAEEVEEIAVLLAELDSLRKAKWDVKQVDTMNDMASLAVALKAAEAERDALRKALDDAARIMAALLPENCRHDTHLRAGFGECEDARDFIRTHCAIAPGTLLTGDNHE